MSTGPEATGLGPEQRVSLRGDISEATVGLLCDAFEETSDEGRRVRDVPTLVGDLLIGGDRIDRLTVYTSASFRAGRAVEWLNKDVSAESPLENAVRSWNGIQADWNFARAVEDIGDTYLAVVSTKGRQKDMLRSFDQYVPALLQSYDIQPAKELSPKGIIGVIRGGLQPSALMGRALADKGLNAAGFLANARMLGLKTEITLMEASVQVGTALLSQLSTLEISDLEKSVLQQTALQANATLQSRPSKLAEVASQYDSALIAVDWGLKVFFARHPEYMDDESMTAALHHLRFATTLRFVPFDPGYQPYNVKPARRIRPHTGYDLTLYSHGFTVRDESGQEKNISMTHGGMADWLTRTEALQSQALAAEQVRLEQFERDRIAQAEVAQQRAAAAALAAELARGRDQERLAELERLVEEQSVLLADFRGVSNSTLRKEHLLGKDSLDFHLHRINHLHNPDGRLNALKTYHGIHEMLQDSPAIADEMLLGTQMADDVLRGMFADLKSHLEATTSSHALLPAIDTDVVWLRDNWARFKEAALQSGTSDEDELDKVAAVLGVPLEEVPEAIEPEASEMVVSEEEDGQPPDSEWTEEQLAEFERLLAEEEAAAAAIRAQNLSEAAASAELKRLAEKLDWVVFPEYKGLKTDDLVDRVRNRFGDNPKKAIDWAVVEKRSADMLLMKEMLGGALYESSVRTFASKDELYFVLTFEYEGAKYALAENPVWGNATYALREDQFPLKEGETVLTVVKELRRQDARALGAKQVVHTTNGVLTHPEKLIEAVDFLAAKPSLFTA